MRTSRAWIFPGLVLVATGLLVYSWFIPLWGLDISMLRPDAVLVRSWGEELFLGDLVQMVAIPTMPAFFAPLLWTYLVICVVLLLSSLVLGDKSFRLGRLRLSLPQTIIAFVGLSRLVFAAVAAIMITVNLGQFEVRGVTVPLQGTVVLDFGPPWTGPVTSSLRLGYWLALVTGILLIVLALLRPIIVGREEAGTSGK